MKKILITLLLSLSALTASAQNPPATPTIIAQFERAGGMLPPTMPYRSAIQISNKGVVNSVDTYYNGKVVSTKLSTLSKPVLAKLKSQIAQVKAGELIDPNPDEPLCTDAPSMTYSVFTASNQKIDISGHYGCKEFTKTNPSSGDYSVVNVLDGLKSLASLL